MNRKISILAVSIVLILLVGLIALIRPERGYGANQNQTQLNLEGSAYQTMQYSLITWTSSWKTAFLANSSCFVETCQTPGGCSVDVTWQGGTQSLYLDPDAFAIVCGNTVNFSTTGIPYPAPVQ